MKFIKYIAFVLVLAWCTQPAFGQKKRYVIQINSADTLKGGKRNGENFSKLIGNVKFTHQSTIIYCDTAYSYETTNSMEAIGHVKIYQGDTITITGKRLFYFGDTRLAQLREDVVYKDDSMTLYTDYLDYDMNKRLAYYYNGGRILDSKNVLVSDKGYYETAIKFASFKDNAVLTTPESVIKGDTLQYDINSDIAYFDGPTTIKQADGTTLVANKGKFITRIEKSEIEEGVIEKGDQIIGGDKLDSDDINRYYTATGNVKLISKKDEVIISGDMGKYWAADSIAKVYGNALMKKVFNGDTLYLSADTLVSIDNVNPAKKMLLAYNNVKIYNNEMQGKADSVAYMIADSTINFFDDPLIWYGENQIEADSIEMIIENNTIDRINLTLNAFVVSKDSILVQYNQIKGRDMIAYFENGKINQVDVFGNAESLYFIAQDDTVFFGMNKIICTDMRIFFVDGNIQSINPYVNPDAELIPPHLLEDTDKQLENYQWRIDEKPSKEEVIYGTRNVPVKNEPKIPLKSPELIKEEEEIKSANDR